MRLLIKTLMVMTILVSSTILLLPISSKVNAATGVPNLFPSNLNKALGANWWQWLLSIPPNKNPILDDHPCDVKQSGSFFYLVGTFGGDADRHCTISKTKGIFFPIFNVVATLDNTSDFNTIAKIKKAAKENIDQATDLQASVDGVNINNINNLRAQSPVFKLKIPKDNVFGSPPGTFIAVADGYWVALKPLTVGEHTIKFAGRIAPDPGLHVTYHITIK